MLIKYLINSNQNLRIITKILIYKVNFILLYFLFKEIKSYL